MVLLMMNGQRFFEKSTDCGIRIIAERQNPEIERRDAVAEEAIMSQNAIL
jgi:hypothetical protein